MTTEIVSAELLLEMKAKEDAEKKRQEELMVKRMLRKAVRQKKKIDKLYFEEALKKYELGEYKLCMIYLNKLTLDTADKCRLLVDVTFDIWKSHHYNERAQYLKYVQGAYGRLFDENGAGEHTGYDFCRLAHVYIFENAFDGAYEVLKLGCLRGHQVHTLVVLNMWSLLARMGTHKKQIAEANRYLDFLSTAAPMAQRDRDDDGMLVIAGSDVPLYIVYLFISWHLKNKFQQVREDKKAEKAKIFAQFNSILVETYMLRMDKDCSDVSVLYEWFAHTDTWFEVGRTLDSTSLPLVAEEAYWQAFLRDKNSRYPLEGLVGCFRRTKRMHLAQHMVEKAYTMNYWNLHTRELLVQVESVEGHWEKYFDAEERVIVKFQSMYRAYVIRKDFIRKMKENLARIIQEEQENSSDDEPETEAARQEQRDFEKLIKERCAVIMANGVRARFLTWKVYVHERVRLKRHSATLIQGLGRKYNAKQNFKRILSRARNANFKYVWAAEMQYDKLRLRFWRAWMEAREIQVKNRAAELIKESTMLYVRAKKFFTATSIVAKMIKIQRRHSDRIVFRHWQERFATRTIKHARVTIRFFVRDQIKRVREREAELAMQAQKRDVMTKFKPKPGPVYKKFMALWREVYLKVRRARAADAIRRWLPARHAHRVFRARVEYYRRLVEWEKGLHDSRRFDRIREAVIKWLLNGKVRKIQRCGLRRNARQRVKRRRALVGHVDFMERRSLRACVVSRMWRWKKYVFLTVREKNRAARVLQRKLLTLSRGRKITNGIARHAHMYSVLSAFHKTSMRLYLRAAWRGANIVHFIRVITRTMDTIEHVQTRGAMVRWKDFTRNLRVIDDLIRVRTTQPLARLFWEGAGDSKAFHRPLIPHGWELPRPRTKILHDDSLLPKIRVFRVWMACFRQRYRKRRANALQASTAYMTEITDHFILQTAKAVMIQRTYRRLPCLRKTEVLQAKAKRCAEADLCLRTKFKFRVLVAAEDICRRRIAARLVMQCAWRCSLARAEVGRRLDYRDRMDVAVYAAAEAMVQARRRRKYMAMWQTIYCHRLSTPVEPVDTGLSLGLDDDHGRLAPQARAPPRNVLSKGDKSIRRPAHAPAPGTAGARTLTTATAEDLKVEEWLLGNVNEREILGLDRDPTAFMGQEFHSAIFRLRQSGVFLVDTDQMGMSPKEVVYCLQRSQTVFCRKVNEEIFNLIMRHFGGAKLVFCEGHIPHGSARGLLALFRNRARTNPLALHLGGEFVLPYKLVEQVVALVAADLVPLSELSVDSDCFGTLGVCALIGAMRNNRTIESLLVNHDGGDYLPCAVHAIRRLSGNDTLRELRLLGAPIDRQSTFELHTSVSYGLRSLSVLEFAVLDQLAIARADAIVEVGKAKASIGQNLSVVVN